MTSEGALLDDCINEPEPMPILTDQERLGTTVGDGRYRIESVLGRGGMGTVFEAVHEWTGRRVAVKLLRHDVASDFEASQRFLQEARSATAIEHPNVVEVLDMGRHDDWTVYMVFELLRGQSLADRLDVVGRLEPMEAVMVLLPVADAVAAAHRLGIVHRDIKPDNIFLEDDGMGYIRPKLLDFGIARAAERKSGQVRTGAIAGTPEYLSPEHAQGFRAGPASDVWSLGIVLFECITGTRPFEADSVLNVLVAIISNPIPSLRDRPDVPEAIAELVERALVRDPDARIPDAEVFRDALAAASDVDFVPSHSRSVPPKILYESGEIALSRAHRVETRQSSPSLGSMVPVRMPTPIPARLSTPVPARLSTPIPARASSPSLRQVAPTGAPVVGAPAPASTPAALRLDSEALATLDDLPRLSMGSLVAEQPPDAARRRKPALFALVALLLLVGLVAVGYRATLRGDARVTGPAPLGAQAREGATAPRPAQSLGAQLVAEPGVASSVLAGERSPAEAPAAPTARALAAEPSTREPAGGRRASAGDEPAASPEPEVAPAAPRTRRSQAGARAGIQRGANGSLILD